MTHRWGINRCPEVRAMKYLSCFLINKEISFAWNIHGSNLVSWEFLSESIANNVKRWYKFCLHMQPNEDLEAVIGSRWCRLSNLVWAVICDWSSGKRISWREAITVSMREKEPFINIKREQKSLELNTNVTGHKRNHCYINIDRNQLIFSTSIKWRTHTHIIIILHSYTQHTHIIHL